MTDPKNKKISRRDAIKLLGAVTGATVLANLPSKWNTPEIASGVLPAHAQTSTSLFSLICVQDQFSAGFGPPTSSVSISPAQSNVSMTWTVIASTGVLNMPTTSGTVLTNGSGVATIDLNFPPNTFDFLGDINVRWTFTNPAQGTGSPSQCIQNLEWNSL
jgi:hypothetical protein